MSQGTPLRFRLSAAVAIALAGVAAALQAIPAAAAAPGAAAALATGQVTILSSPNTLMPRDPATVVVSVPNGIGCRLKLTDGTDVVNSASVSAVDHILQFYWGVPEQAASVRWTANIRCTGVKGAATHTIVVQGAPGGTAPIATSIGAVVVRPEMMPTAVVANMGPGTFPPFGQQVQGASSWFGGHGVEVHSNQGVGCGPSDREFAACTRILSAPDDGDGLEWQSVELANRFVTTEKLGPMIWGNANQLFAAVAASRALQRSYALHRNGTGYVPVPGDLITFKGGQAGHVVIVTDVTPAHLDYVEQGGSQTGVGYLPLSGSTLGAYRAVMPVIGIIHARKNTSPKAGSAQEPVTAISNANTDGLSTYTTSGGFASVPLRLARGSSPSASALAGAGYAIAVNTGVLAVYTSDGGVTDTGKAMQAGASPAIAGLTSGGYVAAYPDSFGVLNIYSSASGTAENTGLNVMDGTAPSIAALSGGGWVAAFQSNSGRLGLFMSPGIEISRPAEMASGTSPSVAGLTGGGFIVAYQGRNNHIITYSSTLDTFTDTLQALRSDTSPSIAALTPTGYAIAYANRFGTLAIYTNTGKPITAPIGVPVAPATRPSITIQGTKDLIAVHAGTRTLAIYDGVYPYYTNQILNDGTSPSIAAPQ